jgi:hypothetical protein
MLLEVNATGVQWHPSIRRGRQIAQVSTDGDQAYLLFAGIKPAGKAPEASPTEQYVR